MQKDCGNFCSAESAENDMQTGGTNTSSEASFAEFHFRRQTGGGREGGRRERKINYDLPIYKSVIGRVLCGEISYTEAAEQIGKLAGRPVLKQSVYRYCQKVKLRNPKTWNEQTAMDRWIAAPTPSHSTAVTTFQERVDDDNEGEDAAVVPREGVELEEFELVPTQKIGDEATDAVVPSEEVKSTKSKILPTFKLVPSTKKHLALQIALGGVTREYGRSMSRDNTVYYRCSQCDTLYRDRKQNTARIIMNDGQPTTSLTPPHHPLCRVLPIPKATARAYDRESRKLISTGTVAPEAAWDHGHNDSVLAGRRIARHFPDYSRIRKSYAKIMRKTIPPVPDPFNIPDDLCLTLGREDEVEAFVMVSNEAERTLIFAADSLLEIAAQSDMIIGDGTFQTSPQGFVQVLTLHCRVFNENGFEWMTFYHAVMTTKCQDHYISVLQALKTRWEQLGVEPKFRLFRTDFERGLQNAVAEIFGEERVGGCLFHLTSAVVKYARANGLSQAYGRKEGPIYQWIRHHCSLGLLPPTLVAAYYDRFLKKPPQKPDEWPAAKWPGDALKRFSTYFRDYWMKEVPIQWWNFFREHDRTTNVAEAYHSDRFRHSHHQPSFSRFLWNLRQKTSAQLSRILQLEEGAKVKEQSKLYMKLDEELFKKFDQFDEEIRAAGTMEDVSSACQRLVSRAAHLLAEFKGAKTVKADRAAERRKRAPPVFSGFLPVIQEEDEHLWGSTMPATRVSPKVKVHLPRPLLPKGKAERFFATRRRPLAPEDQDIIAWQPENAGRVFMVDDGNTVRGYNIQTLRDGVWLDDNVINGVASIVNSTPGHTSYCLHSFFFSAILQNDPVVMARWFQHVPVFESETLIFPIHWGAHWALLLVNFEERSMVYLDSVASSRSDSRTLVMRQRIEAVLREVDPEREEEFRGVPWSYSAPNMGTQTNTSDCGVYLSQWALLQAGGSLTFVSEEEIPGLRCDLARRLQNFHRQ